MGGYGLGGVNMATRLSAVVGSFAGRLLSSGKTAGNETINAKL